MPAVQSRRLLTPRLDFGLFTRLRSWPQLFSPEQLGADLRRGLWLAASTLPLSMLLAWFAGAPASSGIISAAVGSAVCVFLGGTRSALSGPGLTTALLSSHIIAKHGLGGLGTVLFLVGALQMLTGALGVGRFVRLVPLSVLRASVFGTGLVILFRQLPNTIGASMEPGGGVLVHLDELGTQLPRLDPVVLVIALGSGLLGVLSLINPRVPAALLALIAATLVARLFNLQLPNLQEASQLPLPRTPVLPSHGFAGLFGSVFELWGAMTLRTALDTAALERLTADHGPAARTDPDQELIGNGLATMALAFLHGLPATQLVARSAIAVRLGIDRPRPALFQAAVLLLLGALAWPFLGFVPLAALTGIAVSTALPLLDLSPLRALGRVSRMELALSVATIVTMLFSGIVTGLLVGLA